MVTEAEQQLSGFVIPNVDQYMRLRRATAGALPSLAMAEMDLDLPDEVRYHPVIVELEEIMRDVICVVNVGVLLNYPLEVPSLRNYPRALVNSHPLIT